MGEDRVERRLAAILTADVVGYSRLVRADEEDTLAVVGSLISDVIQPAVAEHRGRIFKKMGDAVLAEFGSTVDALHCAMAVQHKIADRVAITAAERRIAFRIGLHVGDVVVDGDDIHGDGVIVSARIEGLATADGICISEDVFRQVEGRIEAGFEDLGPQRLKNMDSPITVYRVRPDAARPGKAFTPVRTRLRRLKWPAVAFVAVIIASVVAWQFGIVPLRDSAPQFDSASVVRMAFPLPDKPSIVVLPLVNLSEDASQEYFVDGMTEDLTTDLAKLDNLFVISRSSSFTYKGKLVSVKQVAEELGVRYVLEGSVQRTGDQVRINVQLIDALTGGHLWAERYDGSLSNIFDLQNEVAGNVVSALAIKLTAKDLELQARRETSSPKAYENVLQSRLHISRYSPEGLAKAIPYLEKAIELDPDYGEAYAALAFVYRHVFAENWQEELGITQGEAYHLTKHYLAKALEHPTPLAYRVSSAIAYQAGNLDEAIAEAEKSIALSPRDTHGYYALARALIYSGRPAEGLDYLDKIVRLNPLNRATYVWRRGIALFNLERYEESIEEMKKAEEQYTSDNTVPMFLAASYAHLGQVEKAKEYIPIIESYEKDGRWGTSILDVVSWAFKKPEDIDRLRAGLRKAGLQEVPFGFADKLDEKVAGEELRSLFYGSKIRATDPESGRKTWYAFTEDGKATNDGPPGWGSGKAWVDEDENFCVFWETSGRICGAVFRNPEGTNEDHNEYFYVYYHGPMPFSPVD